MCWSATGHRLGDARVAGPRVSCPGCNHGENLWNRTRSQSRGPDVRFPQRAEGTGNVVLVHACVCLVRLIFEDVHACC